MNYIEDIKNMNMINKFFLIIAFFTSFLLFGFSTFIWENIPFFMYIQFPHRWLNITTFVVACLSATWFFINGSINRVKRDRYLRIVILFLIFLVCILVDLKYIRTAAVFSEQELIPVKAVNWATEHLPKNVNLDKIDKEGGSSKNWVMLIGNGSTDIVKWSSAQRIIKIEVRQPTTLKVRTFNFPGWTASIDGIKTNIRAEEGVGSILIDIPEGKHLVELSFVDTPIRHYSKYISLLSFFVIIFLLSLQQKDKIKPFKKHMSTP